MLKGKRLAVIGAGKMGEALLRGFLNAQVIEAEAVTVSDVDAGRLGALQRAYAVATTQDNGEAIRRSDIVLLAVKPQQMSDVLERAKESFSDVSLVISIAAGVTTGKIERILARDIPVIRVMPNTPALVGQAMSVISRGAHAGGEEVRIALELFSSVGTAVELPEDRQNEATAISGSGPAYFFLMTEALVEAAKKAGIDADVAKKLVIQTMAGSAALLESTGAEPAELREMVTSPGGTTEAALQVFSKHEFQFIVQEAVTAAIKRAEELA